MTFPLSNSLNSSAFDAEQEDASGACVPELVHDGVGFLARHHGLHGVPFTTMELRHCRGVETRSHFASLREKFGGAVVLDHHVRLGDELALDAADERVDFFEFCLLRVAENGRGTAVRR